MTDLLITYAPGVMALVGFAVGALIGRHSRPRPPEPLRPICSCGHGYGAHEDGRECKSEGRKADHWTEYGHADHWTAVPCQCLRYDGPNPAIFGLEEL